jgi:hypothetical protein
MDLTDVQLEALERFRLMMQERKVPFDPYMQFSDVTLVDEMVDWPHPSYEASLLST